MTNRPSAERLAEIRALIEKEKISPPTDRTFTTSYWIGQASLLLAEIDAQGVEKKTAIESLSTDVDFFRTHMEKAEKENVDLRAEVERLKAQTLEVINLINNPSVIKLYELFNTERAAKEEACEALRQQAALGKERHRTIEQLQQEKEQAIRERDEWKKAYLDNEIPRLVAQADRDKAIRENARLRAALQEKNKEIERLNNLINSRRITHD